MDRPVHIETWKAIGAALNRSERWARTMAERPVDPLPVFRVGAIVRLLTADLDAWLDRQRTRERPRRRRATPATFVEEHW